MPAAAEVAEEDIDKRSSEKMELKFLGTGAGYTQRYLLLNSRSF